MTPDERRLLVRIGLFLAFLIVLVCGLLLRFVQGTASARVRNEPKLSIRP